MMRILVIGSGGREHAILWKLAQSPRAARLYCAPGNGGTAELAENIPLGIDQIQELAQWAQKEAIDLTIVGPEAPLVNGIVDVFQQRGLCVFGPSAQAAALEGSKVFAKELMKKYGIPTGRFHTAQTVDEALPWLDSFGYPVVIKADGLAAGKGVVIAKDRQEAEAAVTMMLREKAFGAAGEKILIEECLMGEEVSVLAFTDGISIVPMVSAQDHKRIYDGDQGPNTGGMGAYAPAPVYTEAMAAEVEKSILRPTVQALNQEGIQYRGVLYAGLMITAEGPKVLEYNARFGDPETQVILPMMETDLVDVAEAVCHQKLQQVPVVWNSGAAVCVVMASGGYPGHYETGKQITGLSQAANREGVTIFHAGTRVHDQSVVTAGGRVLGITATGDCVADAVSKAYIAAADIDFQGAHYRRDIAYRALQRVVE